MSPSSYQELMVSIPRRFAVALWTKDGPMGYRVGVIMFWLFDVVFTCSAAAKYIHFTPRLKIYLFSNVM